jgi:hypothetical protein
VINSNLDVLNLNASKPSLNKKMDLSSNDSQANEFGDELASYEVALKSGSDEALSQNISLSAAGLPNMKSPNQVSEENLKTLTENLNNFSGLKVALPGFNENLVADADEEENIAGMVDQDATSIAMQGLINASAKANTPSVKEPVAENTGSVLNSSFTQTNPQEMLQKNQQVATLDQNVVNSPLNSVLTNQNPNPNQVLPVEGQSGLVKESNPLANKIKGESSGEGKLSLEGFQKITPKALSPEFAANLKQNLNIDQNIDQNVVSRQDQTAAPVISSLATDGAMAELSESRNLESKQMSQAPSVDSKANPLNTEMMALMQNLAPTVENQSAPVADNAAPMAFAPIVGVPQHNQTKNDSEESNGFSGKDKERKVEVMGTEQNFAHIAEKHKMNEVQVKSAEAAVTLPTESQHKTNLDQIVTHARTFLKDGGGEMVMKLTPEGLGTVDLKVAVKDGQVSIEINTQNEHIKKMFEEGSKDLLGALEVQNLKVDSLKVNMADHIQKDMNMNQFNMSDKDFARNFMGQFRDERQGFRNQSLNNTMGKFHAPVNEPGGLRPSSLAMGNSSRLNVVA